MMPQYSLWLLKWCHPCASTPVLGPRPTIYGPRTGVEALGRHHFQSHSENCGIMAQSYILAVLCWKSIITTVGQFGFFSDLGRLYVATYRNLYKCYLQGKWSFLFIWCQKSPHLHVFELTDNKCTKFCSHLSLQNSDRTYLIFDLFSIKIAVFLNQLISVVLFF